MEKREKGEGRGGNGYVSFVEARLKARTHNDTDRAIVFANV